MIFSSEKDACRDALSNEIEDAFCQGMCKGLDQGWNDAIEAAAQFMLDRKVSASEFYARELRKMKR